MSDPNHSERNVAEETGVFDALNTRIRKNLAQIADLLIRLNRVNDKVFGPLPPRTQEKEKAAEGHADSDIFILGEALTETHTLLINLNDEVNRIEQL